MAEKFTYFLSDLHLGASYLADTRERERRVVVFLDSIKETADTIYLLGDILDYWYEYRYVVPRGYVRFFGKLAQLADEGVRIVWLKGNHDIWIYDYLPKELGIEVKDGVIVEEIYGKKCFLSHGDGVGKIKGNFKFIRALFRNKICQRLYANIHPRWTVPFAYRWSNHSRHEGEGANYSDQDLLKGLKTFALNYHMEHPEIDYFIFGHLHILKQEKIGADAEMIILGDWIDKFSYARLGKNGMELVKNWQIGM